ncbi:MAG: UDP-N-acetylmuramate--L-alanine ligase [Anaerolineales bacterium]|jgi:UDP-N-acetylmuramate--alanine ligase
MTHVHFIGIGGTGLSAIARVLLERGDIVSGSDRELSPLAESVRDAGARVFIGHNTKNISGAEIVVRSSAVLDDNVEVQEALAAGIPVYKRLDFLEYLLEGQRVVAIAGTHGKTTTTAMIAHMLTTLDRDPSYIIGSQSLDLGTNAHSGDGAEFIIEADEYDRMFLGLHPQIAVVTSVEHDHPDCFPTAQDFYLAFEEFVDGLMPEGILVGCSDDPGVRNLMQHVRQSGKMTRSYALNLTFGLPEPEYYAQNRIMNEAGGYTFDFIDNTHFFVSDATPIQVELQVPGLHNVSNALAAMAVVDWLGLPLVNAGQALSGFRGTGRRFEIRGEVQGITVIDDYAHHPTEIRATLTAARTRYPGREIWAVWQPHTYSRIRLLFDQYVESFDYADHVLITDVYAARENTPANGFSAHRIVEEMSHPDVHYVPALDHVAGMLLEQLQPQDVLLVLSAGDGDKVSRQVIEALGTRSAQD